MTREDIIRMAREAGFMAAGHPMNPWSAHTEQIEAFAALVAAYEREKVAQWMVERSYATGHGDTIEDLLTEIDWQAAEREREECASVAESYEPTCDTCPSGVSNAIRARGEK
jgi:hypothetical protein